MANWDEWISELLNKTDLVGLVSKYVTLNKKGGTHWGCCPFHHEKTPSFTVSESKGMFYCFGCQTGGNAVTFLSKIEFVPRIEAIKTLAESAGMTLPEGEFKRKADYEQTQKQKQRLLELLKDTARHYYQNLQNEIVAFSKAKRNKNGTGSARRDYGTSGYAASREYEGAGGYETSETSGSFLAAQYLIKRGVEQDMVTRFGIGYSAGYDTLITHLKQKGYTAREMIDAGVAAQKADRVYDVFAKRLIIPILDMKGDVVSFGGRLLEDSDFAKYRNGSQTLVFDKSKNIFAVNLLKRKKQKEGLKSVILVEGYMDVIALHKAGFTNAAASMGTAFTTQQAKLIKNLCDNVYISFDGDSAGQRATLKGLDILDSEGLKVKVVMLPDGLDPDDLIKTRGASEYKMLMEAALPLPAFKIESLKKSHDLTTPDGKSAFAVEAVRVVNSLHNPVEREEYLRLVHIATGYPMNVLYSQADLPEAEPTLPERRQSTPQEETDGLKEVREFILAEIVADRPYVNYSEDIYSLLGDEEAQRLFTIVSEARRRTGYAPGQLYEFVDESDYPNIDRLVNYQFKEGDGAEKYVKCINKLKSIDLERQIEEAKENFNHTKDERLLVAIRQLTIKKNELK